MRKVHGNKAFCADLETTSDKSKYYQRTGGTTIYAISIAPIPLCFDTKMDGHKMEFSGSSSKYNLKHYGDLADMFNYLNNPKEWGSNLVVFFHNGQKFDFIFIRDGLQKYPATWLRVHNIGDLTKEELSYEYANTNFGMWEKSNNWCSLDVALWNEKANSHVGVRFLDSRKYNPNSIETWSNSFLKNTFVEDLYKDRWAGTANDKSGHPTAYNLIDLDKKPLDFDYVEDVKDGVAYCKDGSTYILKDVSTGPQMVKERVGNDVLIMVFVLKYMFIHHLITLAHCNKIFPTLSAGAVASFINMELKDNELKVAVSKDGKVVNDKLWEEIYGSNLDKRVQQRDDFIKGCTGGLTTYHPAAYDLELSGRYLSLDVNSEYPFIATRSLPGGEPVPLNDINPQYICFVKVEFKSVKQLLPNSAPVIPMWGANDYKASEHVGEQHYCYEIKTPGYAYLITKATYEPYTNPKGFKWEGFKIVEVMGFAGNPGLREFMVSNNIAKLNATSSAERLSAKTKSNSFTGKLFQNCVRTTSINPKELEEHGVSLDQIKEKYCVGIITPFNLESLTKGKRCVFTGEDLHIHEFTPAYFSFPCAYAYITAGGRGWLISHIMELCEAFPSVVDVYNDTDSIKMKCSTTDYSKVLAGLDAREGLDDKELGKFKEEDKGEVFGMKVLAAKKYVATNERGYIIPTKSGLSGLKWLDIYKKYKTMDLTADMISPGDEFETRRSKEVEGGVIIEDVILKLSDFKVGRN